MNEAAALLLAILTTLGLAAPAAPPPKAIARGTVGQDVSYPQCGRRLPPRDTAFGIVGVAGGRPFTANPCLASQFAWARTTPGGAAFYMNTANPGSRTPQVNWYGQRSPDAACAPGREAACAYNYGHSAAAAAMAHAQATTGTSTHTMWWLDVEEANAWSRTDLNANLASIRGSIDYLQRQPGVSVGIYSVPQMWRKITGGAQVNLPNWVAGASNLAGARMRCDPKSSFTGGPVVLTQWWVAATYSDMNYAC